MQKPLGFPVNGERDPAKSQNLIKPIKIECFGASLSGHGRAWLGLTGAVAGWARPGPATP